MAEHRDPNSIPDLCRRRGATASLPRPPGNAAERGRIGTDGGGCHIAAMRDDDDDPADHLAPARSDMDALTTPDRRWHAMSPAETLAALATSPDGLSAQEAARRLAEHGPNRLPEGPVASPWRIFLRQFASPLIYILLFAGGMALLLGDRSDALFIFGVLLLNAVIGAFQEVKADASARALRSLVPHRAAVKRDGVAGEIAAEEVVVGDIVALDSGMQVTADLRLIETHGLQIDEAPLTGESLPVTKDAQARLAPDTLLADRVSIAHAGTVVMQGRALGVVVATGGATAIGAIGRSLEEAARTAGETPLIRRMAHLARQIAVATLGLILILAVLLAVQGEGWRDIAMLAIALAVSAIPEGLPIAVTVALSAAASRMAKRNVIVRALPAVEGLGSCTLIASDKTGTLTMNRLTVEKATRADGTASERAGWQQGRGVPDLAPLAEAAALCNEAHSTASGELTGDAVDVALLDFAREAGVDIAAALAAPRLAQIPYEPVQRFAAVEIAAGGATRIIVKGAPETVLAMCEEAGCEEAGEAAAIARDLAREGFRVIALAEGESSAPTSPLADRLHGLRPIGFVGLSDPLREGVAEAAAKCASAGISVRLITGDHPATAIAIARRIGIADADSDVVTGAELTETGGDPDALRRRILAARVFARIEPSQKLDIVRAFRAAGEIVAVTGDGVNDGPALQAADIGIAMGRGGTDVARQASDLVLADDNFASIVAGIEEGRVTFQNVRKIVIFLLATGLAEIGMFLLALVAGLPLPLTPVQLLWLNLVTNGVQDVTLGFGKAEGDELAQPPRRKLAALVDRDALILLLPGAVLMTVLAVWLMGRELSAGASVDQARNGVLLMVVLFQNVYLLGIRNLRRPAWRWGRAENGWLFLGLFAALSLHLLAMNLAPLQALLGTGPVPAEVLVWCLAGAASVLLATEAAKWWVAVRERRAGPGEGG